MGTASIDRVFEFFRKRHRREIADQPFPEAYAEILERNVRYVERLDADERRHLEGLILCFLEEKPFEGCGGFEITDEVRVTVAGQACLLLLAREHDLFPNIDVILVYPSAYRARARRSDGMVLVESDDARLGESHHRGAVVLAWDAAKRGGVSMGDGKNLVLHEFAHQLDGEDGAMDGTPELHGYEEVSEWARILGDEFAELTARLHAGRPTDIDPYGATNPPEFFAVVTEMFFEKPTQMKKRHSELYAELASFYGQDPAARVDGTKPAVGV